MAVVDVNLEAVDSELHGGLLIDLFFVNRVVVDVRPVVRSDSRRRLRGRGDPLGRVLDGMKPIRRLTAAT